MLPRILCLNRRKVRKSVVEVTQDPIIPDLIIDSVRGDSSNGATVSFIGSLRGHSAFRSNSAVKKSRSLISRSIDQKVHALRAKKPVRFAECEGDKQRVEQQLQEIGDEIRAKWQLEDVAICHRVGRIEVGDVIMVVAIAAPHRQEAFEACQYAVDRAKENILIREVL